MPFDGSGNFTRVHNWQQDRDNGIRIVADRHDQEDDNFAQGFNQTFLRNGVVPMSGALNMNGNAIRGIAGGSAASPTMTSVLDPTSGYFSPSPGQLGVSIAGVQRGLWTAAGLAVSGALTTTGNLTVGGNLTFTGNMTVPGTLAVTGTSTFTGKTTHSGGLEATTGNFSGAVALSGPLTSTGAVTLLNLDVTGAAAFGSTVSFTGRTTHSGGITSTTGTFSGAVSTGAFTATTGNFSGTLTAQGSVNVGSDVNATNLVASNVVRGSIIIGTGAESFRAQNNAGVYAFYTADASARTGYLVNQASGMMLMNEQANSPLGLGTAGTPRLHITAGGDIGIGTGTPSTILDIYRENPGASRLIEMRLGVVEFGNQGFATRLRMALTDQGVPFGVLVGPTDVNGWLQFNIGNPSIEAMRITSTGKVGIGSQSPGAPLEVVGVNSGSTFEGGEQTLVLRNTSTTGSARGAGIRFVYGSSGFGAAQIDLINGAANNAGSLSISTRSEQGVLAERCRISATGMSFTTALQLNRGSSLFGTDAVNSPEWFVGSVASGLGSGAGLALFTYAATQPINFYTAGVLRATINGAGQMGIGVAPSASATLNVRAQATAGIALSTDNGANADCVMRFASGLTELGSTLGADVSLIRQGTERARLTTAGMTVQGTITASGDITAFSDERFKTNVRKARGLAAVCAMEGVTFEHISSKRPSAGVIAQELIKVAPELVHMDDRGHYSVNYNGLAAYFIEAIKELNSLVARNGDTE